MANVNHIKWLLEGVESWNARRITADFEPDFEGEDIYESFQQSGKEKGSVTLEKNSHSQGHRPLYSFSPRRLDARQSCTVLEFDFEQYL